MEHEFVTAFTNEKGSFVGVNYFAIEKEQLTEYLQDKQNCAIYVNKGAKDYQILIEKYVRNGARVVLEKWNDKLDKLIFIFKEIPHDELLENLKDFVANVETDMLPINPTDQILIKGVNESEQLVIRIMLVQDDKYLVEMIHDINPS